MVDGGAEAFEAFYASHFDDVYRMAWAFCGSPEMAADATQEAFSRALSRWPRLKGNHPVPERWVATTALNFCRREGKHRRRQALDDQAEAESSISPSGGRVDLLRALRRLPPRRRMAAVLFYLGDLSVQEVAAAMDVSEGAVKAHLNFARSDLQQLLRTHD